MSDLDDRMNQIVIERRRQAEERRRDRQLAYRVITAGFRRLSTDGSSPAPLSHIKAARDLLRRTVSRTVPR